MNTGVSERVTMRCSEPLRLGSSRHTVMKRNLILPLILIALASQQLTAETPTAVDQSSPEGLVSDLYKLDEKKQSPFFQTKDHGVVTKYFSERLAQLIWKDAVTSNGEVGALAAD